MLSFRLTRNSRTGWPEYMADRARTARDGRLQRFFQRWDLSPEMPVAEVPMVALDMETTGLDESRHAIISIGMVPFTLQRIALSRHGYWLVRPPRPLDPVSVTLHHITHTALEQAPDLETVLEEVLEALAGRLVVVHYRNIERSFLNAAVKARLGEELLFPVIDTMELEGRKHRLSRWARLRAVLGRRPVSIRLHDSRLRHGLPAYQPHHAMIDALATAELLQAQIARHYTPGTAIGKLWC